MGCAARAAGVAGHGGGAPAEVVAWTVDRSCGEGGRNCSELCRKGVLFGDLVVDVSDLRGDQGTESVLHRLAVVGVPGLDQTGDLRRS